VKNTGLESPTPMHSGGFWGISECLREQSLKPELWATGAPEVSVYLTDRTSMVSNNEGEQSCSV
jgi:hypothetical protein